MTKKEVMKFSRLFNEMVQREVNGKPHIKWHVDRCDCCGGYCVIINNTSLLFGSDLVCINSIAESLCCSMRLHLQSCYIMII